MRKLIVGSLAAVSIACAAIPAYARTQVDFFVNVAPPVARHEFVPAPRRGFVWVPGTWEWRHGRYFWVSGHWLRARPGYYYAPARWRERGGRYYHERGGWRDADRDGVPNRYDRAPRDPRWR